MFTESWTCPTHGLFWRPALLQSGAAGLFLIHCAMEAPLSSGCDPLNLSNLGQNSRSTAILLSGALKEVHLLHLFFTVCLGKWKTMAQTLVSKFFVMADSHLHFPWLRSCLQTLNHTGFLWLGLICFSVLLQVPSDSDMDFHSYRHFVLSH